MNEKLDFNLHYKLDLYEHVLATSLGKRLTETVKWPAQYRWIKISSCRRSQ